MSDFTYVDNVAHANICAEQALSSNAASVAGKVRLQIKKLYFLKLTLTINAVHWILQPFFVTNDEPIKTWEFMSCMMEAMGCQRYFSFSFPIAFP
jgi:plant 3beta-hydroxysteroid-4alpha-carboxylate 3-dehydrogenase